MFSRKTKKKVDALKNQQDTYETRKKKLNETGGRKR